MNLLSHLLFQTALAILGSASPLLTSPTPNNAYIYLTSTYLNGTIETTILANLSHIPNLSTLTHFSDLSTLTHFSDLSTATNLSALSTLPILPPTPAPLHKRNSFPKPINQPLTKRYTGCWHTPLDYAGVDEAVNILKLTVGDGGWLYSPPDRTQTFAVVSRGVVVYYCINAPGRSGNLSKDDVGYALGRMDRHCAKYSASFFGWDGSVEIVGKAVHGMEICRG